MDVFSTLETTAEISVAFAGFISLFLLLARRDGSLAAEIAVLIRFILLGSIASLFLSAFPLVASALGIAGGSLWRTASCVGLTAGLAMGVFAATQRRGLENREVTGFVLLAWALASLSGMVFVSNIAGWPLPPNGALYLGAIWLTLAIAAVNLVDLVFRFALKEPAA
ncbi:MAG: hypothetical protein QNK04_31975 [Myxococcota bacterium]|nr:hypothetical protein [Myxococcota bacterium]